MASGSAVLTSRGILVSVSVLVAVAACGGSTPAATTRSVPLPVSRVQTLDRNETELVAILRGRPALVSLWATWCEPCKREIPELGQIEAWAKEHDAVVVGVAVGESVDTIASFTAKTPLPYLVVVDEQFRFADAIGSKRVPATLIVDRTGTVVYVGGAVDERSVEAFRRTVGAPSTPDGARGGPSASAGNCLPNTTLPGLFTVGAP